MSPVFIFLASSLIMFSDGRQPYGPSERANLQENDSLQSIRIVNNTSLKSLRRVVKDLYRVMNDSSFRTKFPLGQEGLTVYLSESSYKDFIISASVMNSFSATTFNVVINKYNRAAEDKALAATIIHEITHCVLLSVYRRAQKLDKQ